MKLIDADILKEKLKHKRTSKSLSINKIEAMIHLHAVEDCLEIVRDMPTIDAEPIKHGHWIVADDGVTRCSICYGASDYERSFCGDCGAKMDGGK